ncbi:MAG TPA: ABC transporter ATP-binding protein [Xanthobacteraceae bacterium]|nr:ABC transporter ATP-binding protein [Xanthobacteraceae bacterium]
MNASSNAVITISNVGKAFGPHVVAHDLSIAVAKGEIVALLGRTGAGKSTVLNMIMGNLKPDSGTIQVAGFDPYGEFKKLRGKMAVSFQQDRLLPWRTAVENVELGLLILGIPHSEANKTAKLWLARVNLADAADKYVHQLSGGMRQRVSLARALAVDPELVLLDESFSQLDHVTSKALRADFSKVAREYKKTCLFVTHRIEDAIEMADRVLVLRPGAGLCLEERLTEETRANDAARAALHDRIAEAMGDHDE